MSDDKDPRFDEVEGFVEKVLNKDPEAVALMDRINAEHAARQRGYEAGQRDAFRKFPWPFVMAGGFLAWSAAAIWLAILYPILDWVGLVAVVVAAVWKVKGWKPAAIVAAVAMVAFGGLFYYDSIPPDPETRRMQLYRQDRGYCDKFAAKREEARELLAWEWPKGSVEDRMKHQSVQAELRLKRLDADVAAMSADYEGCMLGQGWEKAWLVDLAAREKARVEECERRGKPSWLCR